MVQIICDGFLVPLNERPPLVQRIRGIGGSGGGLSGLSEGGLGGLGFIQRYRQCRRLSQWSLGGLDGQCSTQAPAIRARSASLMHRPTYEAVRHTGPNWALLQNLPKAFIIPN